MPSAVFELSTSLIIQGLTGLCVFFWVFKDAWKHRRDTREAVKTSTTTNPMVTAVTMSWDADQKERLLQIMERIATANERQAASAAGIATAQNTMVDKRQHDMDVRIDTLLKLLAKREEEIRDLSPMAVRPRRQR